MTDLLVALSAGVAYVVALVDDDESIGAHEGGIHRFRHGADVGFQVIFDLIFLPHRLQIGGTNNQGAACVVLLHELGDRTSGDGLAQSHHIANHRSS